MTDHDMADLLNPEHDFAGWWSWAEQHRYTGPPLTTCRIAAFTHVTPVLLAAGCRIELADYECVRVYFDDMCIYGTMEFAAATTAAIAWLRDNQPEALNRAIAQAVIK